MPTDDPSQKGSNYDDIVRQLHSKSSRHKATREVVIDPKSGEKKVRVRQKRRSSSAKKRGRSTSSETHAINRAINILVGFLVLAVLGFAGIWFISKNRYESPAFSEAVSSQLSERLPGTVQSSNWRVSLNNIRLGNVSYEGTPSEAISKATFQRFETSLPVNEIIRGNEIKLDFLQAQSGLLLLRRAQESYSPEPSLENTSMNWQAPLPNVVSLNKFQVTNLAARFAGQDERNEENERLGLSSSALDLNLEDHSFKLRGGTLRVSGWPTMENLDIDGVLSEDATSLELTNISTSLTTTSIDGAFGNLLAEGSISWRGDQDTEILFRPSAAPIPIKTLIPETSSFINKIRGGINFRTSSPARLVIPARGEYTSPQLSADLSISDLSLYNITFFEVLGRFAGPVASKFFANPQYDSASATISLRDGLWELQDIDLRYRNTENGTEVVIFGELSWSERQQPQGQLLLGVNGNFFSPQEREDIRSAEEGKVVRDFHWQERGDTLFYTRLNVGGENLQLLSSEPVRTQLRSLDTQFPRLRSSTSGGTE